MRRSAINAIIAWADAAIRGAGIHLPPFAHWTPEAMAAPEAAPIRQAGLGWDVTDYGEGDCATTGLTLFTLRNGRSADLARGRGKLYAEKRLLSRDGQDAPLHRHIVKTEDIINRAGAVLELDLFASDPQGGIDRDAPVAVPCDGPLRRLPAGGPPRLAPGESVTLHPGIWHAFRGLGGTVVAGELSTVNDDRADNVFATAIGRFPEVNEDASPFRLLLSDYPDMRQAQPGHRRPVDPSRGRAMSEAKPVAGGAAEPGPGEGKADSGHRAITEVLDSLEALAQDTPDRVTVRAIVKQMGERSFAPLLLVPALIMVSPVSSIPGAPTFSALIIALIAAQMLIGRRTLWLPEFVACRSLPAYRMERAVRWLQKPGSRFERLLKPRLSFLAERPGSYLVLFTCLFITVFMPVMEFLPMMASIAALAITFFAAGLLARDGVVVLVGYGVVGLSVLVAHAIIT